MAPYAVPQLPESVVLHILGFLPATDKAWSTRRVCKAAHRAFNKYVHICATRPRLSHGALKALYEHAASYVLQRQLIAARAGKGDLAGVQWLGSKKCEWDYTVCAEAALGGHLGVLKWTRSQGCPWENMVCYNAALAGQLETLQWLRGQHPPCPWDY